MPVARRGTPPTSQIKEHKSVLTSLSAWTDTGEEESVVKPKKHGNFQSGYRELAETEQLDTGAAATWKEKLRWLADPEGDHFNMIVGLVIISNALVIGAETQYGSSKFVVLEHLFNCVFFTEMILRIRAMGKAYFESPWNIFDFTLVCTGTLDLWILPIFTTGGATKVLYNFSVMRMLRILRLFRVLRVVRLFRMFQHLYLIMQAFSKAFQIVLLMGLLVLIIDYVCAIMLTQGIGHRHHLWQDDEDKQRIVAWFGSIPNSMQTLFMIMTLSGWDEVSYVLTKALPAHVVYICLVLYIMVTSYTMLSLVTGIISESLITSQQEYRQRKEKSFSEKRKELSNDLRETLYALHEEDKDEYSNVPPEELKTTMKGDTDTLMRLAGININIDEPGVLGLIDRLADGQSCVNIDYFVDKLTHLNGMASASTMMDLKYEISKMQIKCDKIATKLGISSKGLTNQKPKDREQDQSPASHASQYSTPTKRSSLRMSGPGPIGSMPSEKKDAKPRFAEE